MWPIGLNKEFHTSYIKEYGAITILFSVPKSCSWWYMPIIPELRKLRQEDGKFKASLSNIARPYLKKPNG
jgi:hypothetical protein